MMDKMFVNLGGKIVNLREIVYINMTPKLQKGEVEGEQIVLQMRTGALLIKGQEKDDFLMSIDSLTI